MQIFISYRRADSLDATGRIHDHLNIFFGSHRVFRDIDQLKGGRSFPDELATALSKCSVMLAVIGPNWLNAASADGRVRLHDPADYVRIEIATALMRDMPIIPVLVGGASMPLTSSLPENIQALAFIHAIAIPPAQGFIGAMDMLVQETHNLSGIPLENYLATLRDCQRTGLVHIDKNFRSDNTVLHEMEHSEHLLVVMNDGRGWLDQNKEIVLSRMENSAMTTKVVLLHPKSAFLSVLIQKNEKRLDVQRSDIERTYRTLTTSGSSERLQVRGHLGFNGYSLIMGARYAYVSPYLYNETGALPLLKFASSSPGGIYAQLKADAEVLFDKATPLTDESFIYDSVSS